MCFPIHKYQSVQVLKNDTLKSHPPSIIEKSQVAVIAQKCLIELVIRFIYEKHILLII